MQKLRKIKWRVLLLLGLLLEVANVKAEFFLYSDLDGVLFGNASKRTAGLNTKIRLMRVDEPFEKLRPELTKDPVIEVLPEDLAKLMRYGREQSMLSGSSHHRGNNIEFKLSDGRTMMAGDYYFYAPQSYQYFFETRSHIAGDSWLLQDFKEALSRHPDGKGLQGEAYDYFRLFLSNESLAKQAYILTARGATALEWNQVIDLFLHGENAAFSSLSWEHRIPVENIIGIFQPHRRDLLSGHSAAEKKVSHLKEHLKRVVHAPLKAGERYHTVVFIDDDRHNIELTHKLFQSLSRDNAPVRYVLWNAGHALDIEDSGRPKISVYSPDGTPRAAKTKDLMPPELRVKASPTADKAAEQNVSQALKIGKKIHQRVCRKALNGS